MLNRSFLTWILSALLATALTACGGGGGSDTGGNNNPPPEDVSDDDSDTDNDDNEDDVTEDPPDAQDIARQIHSLGLTGAQGLVITGQAEAETNAQAPDTKVADSTLSRSRLDSTLDTQNETGDLDTETLYKVTEDGRLERVPFNDEDGNEMDRGTISPRTVVEVGPDFVYLAVTIEYDDLGSTMEEQIGLLVNKDTGLAYLANEEAFGSAWDWLNLEEGESRAFSNGVRVDPAGNLFFINDDEQPLRVDTSNLGSGNLTAQALVTLHEVRGFELSRNGEILAYSGWNDNDDQVYMVYDVREDELHNARSLPGAIEQTDPAAVVRGLDGQLYLFFFWRDENDVRQNALLRIERNSSGELALVDRQELEGRHNQAYDDHYQVPQSFGQDHYGWNRLDNGRKVVNGRLIYTDRHFVSIYEVDIDGGEIIRHNGPQETLDHTKNFDILTTDSYLWIQGTRESDGAPVVIRYNPATEEMIPLTFDQNFELSKFDPMEDRILFEGIRLSDQAKVVGEMTVEGEQLNVSVYETSDAPILTLRAITPADFIRVDGNSQDWNTDLRVLSGSAGDGAAGSDLVHYSQTMGPDEYFGLVEFDGDIASEHFTRIRFDTHEVVIGPDNMTVKTTGDESGTTPENARVATGSAVELALANGELGGSLPDLQAVERFEKVRYGAVSGVDELSGNEEALELAVTLGSPIGEQVIEIPLSDTETLALHSDSAVFHQEGQDPATLDSGSVVFPEELAADAQIEVTLEAARFEDTSAIYDDFSAESPAGVLVEETRDLLD